MLESIVPLVFDRLVMIFAAMVILAHIKYSRANLLDSPRLSLCSGSPTNTE